MTRRRRASSGSARSGVSAVHRSCSASSTSVRRASTSSATCARLGGTGTALRVRGRAMVETEPTRVDRVAGRSTGGTRRGRASDYGAGKLAGWRGGRTAGPARINPRRPAAGRRARLRRRVLFVVAEAAVATTTPAPPTTTDDHDHDDRRRPPTTVRRPIRSRSTPSPPRRSPRTAPASYRIIYDVVENALARIETITVRRPYESLVVSTRDGAIISGTATSRTSLWTYLADREGWLSIQPELHRAAFDQRPLAAMATMVALGRAEERGTASSSVGPARSSSPAIRSRTPGAIAPTDEESTEVCIDDTGLVLHERWQTRRLGRDGAHGHRGRDRSRRSIPRMFDPTPGDRRRRRVRRDPVDDRRCRRRDDARRPRDRHRRRRPATSSTARSCGQRVTGPGVPVRPSSRWCASTPTAPT